MIELVAGIASGGGGVAVEVSTSFRNMKLLLSTGIHWRRWAMNGACKPLRLT